MKLRLRATGCHLP